MNAQITQAAVESIVNGIFEHGKEVAQMISDLNDQVAELKNSAVDDVTCLTECIRDAKNATHKIKSYTNAVDDVFYYWRKGKERVQEGLNQKDYYELKIWIETLQRRLSTCNEQYDEYKKCRSHITELLRKGIQDCQKHVNKVDGKKTTTQVAGGVASGAALAGAAGVAGVTAVTATGIGISIFAGIFTFGIGTAIGLGVTAAAAGAVGVAAAAGGTAGAIAVSKAARKYDKLIETLECLQKKFSKVEEVFNRRLEKVFFLKEHVDNFARAVKDLETEAGRPVGRDIQQLMDAFGLVDNRAAKFNKK